MNGIMPIHVKFLNQFPDLLAFGIAFVISIALALGVKASTTFNNICTAANLIVIVYSITVAAIKANPHNWSIKIDELSAICPNVSEDDLKGWGKGGFVPYGFQGIMQGAATCFFGFVGFDCIATTGEEALRPQRNIPLAIVISLGFVFVSYVGLASTLTLAVPYCKLDENAPLVNFFTQLGWNISKWFVTIGALLGFSSSLMGALLPMPRILYAMAEDGIIFGFFGKINKRFKTPMIATLISGTFAGLMAMILSLKSLVDMMSIGTLMAYTIVALSVMILRYDARDDMVKEEVDIVDTPNEQRLTRELVQEQTHFKFTDFMNQLFNTQKLKEPTLLTQTLVNYITLFFCFACFSLMLMVKFLLRDFINGKEKANISEIISKGEKGLITGITIVFLLVLIGVIVIARQPQSNKKLNFKVPFVPWLPAVSTIINVYLMVNLNSDTWIRFGVWMGIGLPLYFLYGYRNSKADDIFMNLHHQDVSDNLAGPSRETINAPDHSHEKRISTSNSFFDSEEHNRYPGNPLKEDTTFLSGSF